MDNHPLTAQVDTGADYSVISADLAAQLRKVTTPWGHGTNLRTAGGHLLTPLGMCTARLRIRESTYIVSFVVLRECSQNLILGMDFLREHGAIINLRDLLITLSNDHTALRKDAVAPTTTLRIADDTIALPPRASMLVTVESDCDNKSSGIAETNLSVLLARQICVARAIVKLKHRRTQLLITNFGGQYQHLAKRTAIANFEAIDDEECSTIAPIATAAEGNTALASTVDVNCQLSCAQQQQIRMILRTYSDCFASTSKIKQTPTVSTAL